MHRNAIALKWVGLVMFFSLFLFKLLF